MNPLMQRAIDRLLRLGPEHPFAVLAVIVVISAVAAANIVDLRTGLPRLVLDPSIDSLLPTDDERRLYYERTKELFDSGEIVLVALAADDIFTPDILARGQRISERIEELELVSHVSSLSTAMNIRSEGGDLVVESFFETVPEDAAGLEELRRRALADPIYAGSLVSLDARVMVIVVQLLDLPARELLESGIDELIADVRATSDVRLLRLSWADFDRLKRRYPRIGAQLYANLSKVLADRLTSLTEHVASR